MLDVMRKYSRSFLIYIFLGMIIAVFVVNFGPQSAGLTAAGTDLGNVEGAPIRIGDFSYALNVSGVRGRADSPAILEYYRGQAMDALIARYLLADDAKKIGVVIPEKMLQDMIYKGRFVALGRPQSLFGGGDGKFDYDLFRRFIRTQWGLSVKKFKDQQREELLAEKLRQVNRTATKASPDEIKADFIHKNTKVALNYVRFSPAEFRKNVALNLKAIDAFKAKNKDKIKKKYETRRTAYVKRPKEVRLQVIRVNFQAEDNVAEAKAAALHKRVKGGEDFGTVATAESDDINSKNHSGLLGWRNEAAPGLPAKAKAALPGLKVGAISDVIKGNDHLLIVKVLAKREGDLKFNQVEDELARTMLIDEQSKMLATATASTYFAKFKAGKKFSELFTEATKDGKQIDSRRTMQSTQAFPRSAQDLVPGIGISKELMSAAFKLQKEGEVVPKAQTVGSAVYLVALKERTSPDMSEWTKEKEKLAEAFTNEKWFADMRSYLHERCSTAAKKKAIFVQTRAIRLPQAEGEKPRPLKYSPCSTLAPAPQL
jgi:hypothetical protein